MDFELLFYGLLPITIGIFEIIYSSYLTSKNKNIFGFIATILITIFNIMAVYMLMKILDEAWPSFLPHFLILISSVIFIIQIIINKRNKTFANNV